MVKILVLFYSTYGHIYQCAKEFVAGAKEVDDVEIHFRRVAETLPDEVLTKMHALEAQKQFAEIPIADPQDFANYDGYIFGFPTRFGQVPAQMKMFLDALGGVWASNACVGKPASCFTSSGTQHGGQESTLLAMHHTLFHLGMVVVGLPYSCTEQMGIGEINGGSPYGMSTIAGPKGERMPSEAEKKMARFQGKHLAVITKKLAVKDPKETATATTTTKETKPTEEKKGGSKNSDSGKKGGSETKEKPDDKKKKKGKDGKGDKPTEPAPSPASDNKKKGKDDKGSEAAAAEKKKGGESPATDNKKKGKGDEKGSEASPADKKKKKGK